MLQILKLKPLEPYGSNCYLLASAGEFVLIDPSADYTRAVMEHPEIQRKVKFVLLTHAHFDHMLGINSWAQNCETVYVGFEDAGALSDANRNCYLGFLGVHDGYEGAYKTLTDGDSLAFGDERIEVIACPGHTPGGLSFKIGNSVFCGDTVFAKGGYGRCDLPGGDINVLEKTLIRLITTLPSGVVLYPGHGENTTLEELIYYFM